MLTLTEFDMADYLNTEELRCEYLADVERDGDKEEMRRARCVVERARNMERYMPMRAQSTAPSFNNSMEMYDTPLSVAL